MVKGYNLTIDYALYEMSYANMIMYGSVLPSYSGKDEDAANNEKIINADDPGNRELVRSIMFDE